MQTQATEELHIQTAHYNFTVNVTNRFYNDIHISKHYLVGKEAKPCMSLSFYTPESINIFSKDIVSTANLNTIESLRECIDDEIANTATAGYEIEDPLDLRFCTRGSTVNVRGGNPDTSVGGVLTSVLDGMITHSFGNELLQWVYTHLRDNYKHITKIKLDDESYIPCNRPLDTLDLMTYSIAHYKESWYEKNYKAYLLPENIHKKYRDGVEKYSSKEFKDTISWERFYTVHFQSSTEFAYRIVSGDIEKYKTMYESSVTFPDFFKALTETLQYTDKCKFYKSWLQQFINSVIPISRRWYITIKQSGGKRIRKETKRNNRRTVSRNSKTLS